MVSRLRSAGLPQLIILVCLLSFALGAQAQSKGEIAAQIDSLGEQIMELKVNRASPAVQSQLDSAMAQYRSLAGQISYDPLNLAPASASRATSRSKAAPAAPPGGTATTTSFSNGTAMAIADSATTTSTIEVTGVGTYLFDADLSATITHTFASDLDMTVTSPSGTVTTISTDNGAGNDDVFGGNPFDDQAAETVTDFVYTDGVAAPALIPEGAMAAFVGEDPNGTWTFEVFDDAAGDTGSLDSWSLDITTLDDAPIETASSFSDATVLPITDNATTTGTLEVSGLDTYLCDVDLTAAITHTFASDLEMTLVAPSGATALISTNNGAGNDDVFNGTTFNDGATELATDTTYTNGVAAPALVPEGALAALVGEDPNGTWSFDIFDDAAGDTGNLNSWSLDLTTCVATPAASDIPTVGQWGRLLFLMSLLGAGLLLISRRLF